VRRAGLAAAIDRSAALSMKLHMLGDRRLETSWVSTSLDDAPPSGGRAQLI
jgi:hypothetical protein